MRKCLSLSINPLLLMVVGYLFVVFTVVSGDGVDPAAVSSTAFRESLAQEEDKNRSTLLINVAVSDGKLIVDRTKSAQGFKVSDEFKRVLRLHVSESELEKTITTFRDLLFDDLDTEFKSMDRIYRYALPDNERATEPQDDLTKKIRTFPSNGAVATWETFSAAFENWAAANDERDSLRQVFSDAGLLTDLNDIGRQTALIFNASVKKPPRPFNAERGTINFRVADPIGDLEDQNQYVISFPNEPDAAKAASKRKNVLKLLKRFSGQLWRAQSIKTKIEEFYAERGLIGVVKISPAGKLPPKEIEIPEGSRIARVLFSKDIDADAIDRIAYVMLPHKDFRTFVKKRPLKPVTGIGGELAYHALDFLDLDHTVGTEPFINQFQFQLQQLELSQLGFVAIQAEAPSEIRPDASSSSFVEIFVNKAEKEESGTKPDSATEPANPVPNEQGVLTARPDRMERRTGFVPPSPNLESANETPDTDEPAEPTPSPEPGATPVASPSPTPESNTWRPKDKQNYLGFGISYKPGQKVRLFGIYQRTRLGLLPQDDFGIKVGAQEKGLGAVNYSADYVFFNKLHRKLSLQFSGTADYAANRVFSGIQTDERRVGGVARADLELLRNWRGSIFRVYVEGRRSTVELTQGEQLLLRQNLSTLDVGGLFMFESREAYQPKQFRLEPMVRIGLALARGEPAFVTFGLASSYHQQLPHYLDVDINARFKIASGRTPIYELPSLGGADSLRGFREDDGLGTKLWSVQNELWMPLPAVGDEASGLQRFLRRQVRLAGFVDVGGIYGTTTQSGMRVGPGLGLRIIYQPAIIKLDWAYGIGNAATSGRGHGRFYFSVGTNLPF